MLVIPIGKSLLYVEPVYLQAERSPMPELRLVVLATQEKLSYGTTFAGAFANLGGLATVAPSEQRSSEEKKRGEPEASPTPQTPSTPQSVQTLQQLVTRAIQEFEDYQRLTSQGKLGEAGQKLEQHKRTLDEIKRLTNK